MAAGRGNSGPTAGTCATLGHPLCCSAIPLQEFGSAIADASKALELDPK